MRHFRITTPFFTLSLVAGRRLREIAILRKGTIKVLWTSYQ